MVAKWQEENFSNGVVYNGKEDEKLMHDDFQSWVYNEVGVSLNTKDIATLSYEDEYYKTYYKTPKGRTENTLFHLANASEVELTDALNKLNGIFSFIFAGEESVIICVDRVRTFPLFYKRDQKKIIISDDESETEVKK